ncbi:LOW QUALITY PROTEIN: hypothetical protein LZ30DRAFT_749660 [Colletotrichum cereale]|nr:LOW QUALITY PROTEIN: hypothetical protein LZ30DRAFT_749660 [Colletotrichum cereale]
MTLFKAMRPLKDDGLDLTKPFSSNEHHALAKEVERLIKKRGDMGSQMAESMKHLDQSDDVQLQQELLLQIKVLVDREKLFTLDPSDARARDVEILKTVLFKLRDENQTPKSGRRHKSSSDGDGDTSSVDQNFEMSGQGGDNNGYHTAFEKDLSTPKDKDAAGNSDGTKTKKRKRADGTTPALKKAKTGQIGNHPSLCVSEVSTMVDGQKSHEDINMKMEKSAKKRKDTHKNADACLWDSKASKDHGGTVNAEIRYGYGDEAKKHKAKKNKKLPKSPRSPKSKSSFIVKTEHVEKDENSKKPTGQVSEAERHTLGSADKTLSKKKTKKKERKKKQRAETATPGSDNLVAIDADKQTGLGELETSLDDDRARALEKEEPTEDVVVNTKQESPELSNPVQITDGNKKTQRKNRTNSRVSHFNHGKAQESGIQCFKTAFATANPTFKGSTRIEPPVIPVPPFSETTSRTPLNPWSAYRRAFSIQNAESIPTPVESTEKATKLQDGKIWVTGTTGSRKKGGRKDSDTKTVAMTIGKVDAPLKVDQGSHKPPPKKEQKKNETLERNSKKPVVTLESRSAVTQGQTSAPGVRVSEDLVRLITPYAALLGSRASCQGPGEAQRREEDLVQGHGSPAR